MTTRLPTGQQPLPESPSESIFTTTRTSTRRQALSMLATAIAAPSLASLGSVAHAQAAWPSKPIKIILPFPAGSGTDSSARFIGQSITQQTGQPVVIDNRAGANGFIAAQAAAGSAPDGYTVFVTTMTTQSVNPHLYKQLPYDPAKDFAPVSLISKSPMLLVVRPDSGQPKTIAELAALAKKGKLSYASGNTSSRVAAEVFRVRESVDVVHVPYKGTPQALTDLMGGQVDFMFPDLTPSVPLVKAGKLRALAVTGNARLPGLPDVPTVAELGYPELGLVTWSAAFLPAATPPAIVEKLSQLIGNALRTSDATEYYAKSGSAPSPTTPAGLRDFTKSEYEVWGKAIRTAGIQPE